MKQLTCGNFRSIPAVCINSQPKMRRSVSVSASNPSMLDGVFSSFSSGKRQFCNVKTIFPYGFWLLLFAELPILLEFVEEFSFPLIFNKKKKTNKTLASHKQTRRNVKKRDGRDLMNLCYRRDKTWMVMKIVRKNF